MMRAATCAAVLLMLAAGAARADGLADMKSALSRAAASSPFKALVDTRITRKLGEGKDTDDESGQASVAVEESARGLGLTYSKATLARVDAEMRVRSKNPNSKTPTVTALLEVDVRDLMGLTSAAPALLRRVERDAFKGERSDTWQGKPARVLTFEAPISTLSDRERKYAKKFLSVLEVWINADGMPLASRGRVTVSGRAFVVVSFDSVHQEDSVYSAVGDRLLMVRKEASDNSSGAGEREERKVVTTVQLQP
ncbi:MAG: hypothetical protein V4631_24315 [Pseudomonadota bacterium]